ncbi:MAG: hypothetical protein U5K79_16090 [Cyclobacteriaceae bacterium]|nr:hypothetical protein [Cyclobacteriaceae bacterium]
MKHWDEFGTAIWTGDKAVSGAGASKGPDTYIDRVLPESISRPSCINRALGYESLEPGLQNSGPPEMGHSMDGR